MDETHVEHAVGFIEHQHLHLAEVKHALLQQVQQTARGGDQNVDAPFHLADLGVHADAAKHHGGCQFDELAVSLHRLFHLRRQFTRGREHQRADAVAAKFVGGAGACAQFVQHWQHKGSGFTSAGLRAAKQVMPGQHHRNSFRLDSRGGFVTMLAHGFHNGRGQVQIIKVHLIRACPQAPGIQPIAAPQRVPESVKAESVRGGTEGCGSCVRKRWVPSESLKLWATEMPQEPALSHESIRPTPNRRLKHNVIARKSALCGWTAQVTMTGKLILQES